MRCRAWASTREVWAIQQTPQGDMYVAYIAGEDIAHAFKEFAASQTEFDRWFKQQLQETTGADLNTPPPGPISEILADTDGLIRRDTTRWVGAGQQDPPPPNGTMSMATDQRG